MSLLFGICLGLDILLQLVELLSPLELCGDLFIQSLILFFVNLKSGLDVVDLYHNNSSNKTDDLLRWLCEDFLQMPPGTFRDAQVLRTEHGKPYLPDLPVEVSVSHTGRLFAALIAEEGVGPVGLDVQSMRTASYEKIARRFFKEEEYA